MKKYLFKIIPIFLAIVIFPMASGLCFQNFSGLMFAPKVAMAATSSHEALLPCCLDSSHPGLTILSQSLTFDKFVAAPLVFGQAFFENSKIIIYHNPIIPPPELSMVKTTVLRL